MKVANSLVAQDLDRAWTLRLHRGRQLAVGAAVAVVQSLLHRFHACAVGAMAAVVGAMAAFAQQVALLADGRRAHTPSAGSGQC